MTIFIMLIVGFIFFIIMAIASPPKISKENMKKVNLLSNQLRESKKIINSTMKPEVFFGRMGFALDTLLEMEQYEKYKVFDVNPSEQYKHMVEGIESTVDAFIDRSYKEVTEKVSKLKTKKARENNMDRYFETMKNCFAKADTFWSGDNMRPHYIEKLYTENNLEHLHKLNEAYENEKSVNSLEIRIK